MKKAVVLIGYTQCPRNVLHKYRIEDYLKANGYDIVENIKDCDLAVYSSCGVTLHNQKLALSHIESTNKEIIKQKSKAKLVVAGCLPAQNKEKLDSIHNGSSVSHKDLDRFDEIIDAQVPISTIKERHHITSKERKPDMFVDSPWKQKYSKYRRIITEPQRSLNLIQEHFRSRLRTAEDHPFDYYQMGDETWCVRTSSGCLGKCSYCIIRKAKGKLQSRPKEEIVEEVRQGVDEGYKWISLIADDNGHYGRDIGTTFPELLEDICNVPGHHQIIIDSLNGADFNEQYSDLLTVFDTGKIKRVTLSLQHVNTRILSSMKRPYDVSQLKSNLIELSSKFDDFVVDYHFIVGYPGETEEEFQELLAFAKWSVNFNPHFTWKSYIFSPIPGTLAAKLPHQVQRPKCVKRQHELEAVHPRGQTMHRAQP